MLVTGVMDKGCGPLFCRACASITSRIKVEGLASVAHVSQYSAVELWPTRGETFEEDVGAVRGKCCTEHDCSQWACLGDNT